MLEKASKKFPAAQCKYNIGQPWRHVKPFLYLSSPQSVNTVPLILTTLSLSLSLSHSLFLFLYLFLYHSFSLQVPPTPEKSSRARILRSLCKLSSLWNPGLEPCILEWCGPWIVLDEKPEKSVIHFLANHFFYLLIKICMLQKLKI